MQLSREFTVILAELSQTQLYESRFNQARLSYRGNLFFAANSQAKITPRDVLVQLLED